MRKRGYCTYFGDFCTVLANFVVKWPFLLVHLFFQGDEAQRARELMDEPRPDQQGLRALWCAEQLRPAPVARQIDRRAPKRAPARSCYVS